MASVVREYLLQDLTAEDEVGHQANDIHRGAWYNKVLRRLSALQLVMKDETCTVVLPSGLRKGEPCGRKLSVWLGGTIMCPYHECYTPAFAALRALGHNA